MANIIYNRGLAKLADYNWESDALDLGVMLVTASYTPLRTHNIITDVTPLANEAVGAGYGRIGVAAALRTTLEDDASSLARLKITDGSVVWTSMNAGLDLRIVLFFVTGTGAADNSNYLLAYIDTGTNIPINSNGGDVTLQFNADGVFTLAQA
jgi:hypothetical protein